MRRLLLQFPFTVCYMIMLPVSAVSVRPRDALVLPKLCQEGSLSLFYCRWPSEQERGSEGRTSGFGNFFTGPSAQRLDNCVFKFSGFSEEDVTWWHGNYWKHESLHFLLESRRFHGRKPTNQPLRGPKLCHARASAGGCFIVHETLKPSRY